MPHILVTNDDGYQAPALAILARALRRVGEVTVFAPDHNWSAAGHTKTMHKPLRITKRGPRRRHTPVHHDRHAVGLRGAGAARRGAPAPFDLVVSGINIGANLGHDITYSGTVAAAMEGAVFGRPAIAASMDHDGRQDRATWSSRPSSSRRLASRCWSTACRATACST